MAEHDGNPNGYVPTPLPTSRGGRLARRPDERHEASADDDYADLDEIDARYLRTLATPSYDMGQQTDSFVVDLTAAESAAARHAVPTAQDLLGSEPAASDLRSPRPRRPPRRRSPADRGAGVPATRRQHPRRTTRAFDITPAGARPPSTIFEIPPVPVGTSTPGAESLTASTVLRQRRARPQSGWRKRVYADHRRQDQLWPVPG